MPLSRGLQQGGKTGTGCLTSPGACIESLFLLPPGKPLLLQTMNSATPPHCFMFTFSPSIGQDSHFFCRVMRDLKPKLRHRLSFSRQLSSRNGMTALKFKDPVDYFGVELLSLLLLFLFDMFLLFMLLRLSKNYNECRCILLIYLINQ